MPFDVILDAYERTGSIRGASSFLTISRWAVERRLEEAGVSILDRDEALAQVRRLRAHAAGPRRMEAQTRTLGEGVIGCTVVTITRSVPYSPCVWPECEAESQVGAACADHQQQADAAPGYRCAWPGCVQDVLSTACCDYHDKMLRGLIVKSA